MRPPVDVENHDDNFGLTEKITHKTADPKNKTSFIAHTWTYLFSYDNGFISMRLITIYDIKSDINVSNVGHIYQFLPKYVKQLIYVRTKKTAR